MKMQEAENQIVTHYEVFDQRPSDSICWRPRWSNTSQQFGRAPEMVAADAASSPPPMRPRPSNWA